jgi:pimeloyl-ACP methyl ester carboxylesterase
MTGVTSGPMRQPDRGLVIALHCSGAGAAQWRQLGAALASGFTLRAPEHYGTPSTGPWTGEHAFNLADEAARTIALIDDSKEETIHLVGHSYGGGVALRVAMERPDRVASLSLYEPSAFHLLANLGVDGEAARAEIVGVMRACAEGVVTGDLRRAAAHFVNYWNGPGAWNELKDDVRAGLIRWLPKAVLDFRALLSEPTPLFAYRSFSFPVLVMRGEHAPNPTRLIADALWSVLTRVRAVTFAGAGHMGPLTHASAVNAAIIDHIVSATARCKQAA